MNDKYTDYLTSKDYLRRKQELLELSPTCVWCNKSATLLHHLRYDNLGMEQLKHDVIPLCKTCHEKVHNLDDYHTMDDYFRNHMKTV